MISSPPSHPLYYTHTSTHSLFFFTTTSHHITTHHVSSRLVRSRPSLVTGFCLSSSHRTISVLCFFCTTNLPSVWHSNSNSNPNFHFPFPNFHFQIQIKSNFNSLRLFGNSFFFSCPADVAISTTEARFCLLPDQSFCLVWQLEQLHSASTHLYAPHTGAKTNEITSLIISSTRLDIISTQPTRDPLPIIQTPNET